MKKYLCLFIMIIVGLFFSLSPAIAVESNKLGVVDLQRCVVESVEGKKVFEKLKKKKDAMQEKLDEKRKDLLSLKDELEKQSMMLSVDAKEDKEKAFERKSREFKFFYEDLNDEMRKAEAAARKRILNELQDVVAKIGDKDNYLMILERRSSGIIYFRNTIDITDGVIKAYDQKKK